MISLSSYSRLPTEQNNPASIRIDQLPIRKALQIIHQEDRRVHDAFRAALPRLEKAVRQVVASLSGGGRLFFLGAGTSGRLGILEAAECPPTFNTPPSLVQAFMAGGRSSVFRSKEGAEDRGRDAEVIVRRRVKRGDVVVGIAASGVTPFVGAGLAAAKARGARTILVTCFPGIRKSIADVVVAMKTGPEVISGSTRLKAGTATKLALNALTVTSMIQLGKVYRNWMVDLQPRSRKLEARALRLISVLGRVSPARAKILMRESGGRAKTAIVMARLGVGRAAALRRLKAANGRLYLALGERR